MAGVFQIQPCVQQLDPEEMIGWILKPSASQRPVLICVALNPREKLRSHCQALHKAPEDVNL